MNKRFDRKNVLVTGAAAGLGLAIAQRFLDEGARVVLTDLRQDAAEAAVSALGADAEQAAALAFDVRNAEAVTVALAAAWNRFDGLDILINNAGIYPAHGVLVEQERPGAIVNITSGSANRARFGAAHYSASKAGLEMLTRSLALELARSYIRVNAVSPSFIDTQSQLSPTTADYADAIQATRPWPRHGTPEDIAQAVAYLCSEEAEWITGTTLRVDGGRSIGDFELPMTEVRPAE